MDMTISKDSALYNFPASKSLKDGESVQTSVRSSGSPTGFATVNVTRLTSEYFHISQLS